MVTDVIIYNMKMAEEKCREVLSDATMRLYGLKTFGIGIGIWALSLLISYLINDTISSWIFWGVGAITLLLMIVATISFSPHNINTAIGIPLIQRKILQEAARRNNLLLLMLTEILDNAKNEVMIHGRSSYLIMLRNRYSDFFETLKKSPNFKLNHTQMEYGSYWWRIERYINSSEELRKMLAKYDITSDTTIEEIRVKLLKSKNEVTDADWRFIGFIADSKIDIAECEKNMQREKENCEILQSFIATKFLELENMEQSVS